MICSSTLSHLVLVQDIKPDGSLEKNPEEKKKTFVYSHENVASSSLQARGSI